MESQLISFLRRLDWKMEVGEGSMIIRLGDNSFRQLLLAVPLVDRRIRGFFLYFDISVRKFVSDALEASSTIALRGLGYQITTDAC